MQLGHIHLTNRKLQFRSVMDPSGILLLAGTPRNRGRSPQAATVPQTHPIEVVRIGRGDGTKGLLTEARLDGSWSSSKGAGTRTAHEKGIAVTQGEKVGRANRDV